MPIFDARLADFSSSLLFSAQDCCSGHAHWQSEKQGGGSSRRRQKQKQKQKQQQVVMMMMTTTTTTTTMIVASATATNVLLLLLLLLLSARPSQAIDSFCGGEVQLNTQLSGIIMLSILPSYPLFNITEPEDCCHECTVGRWRGEGGTSGDAFGVEAHFSVSCPSCPCWKLNT